MEKLNQGRIRILSARGKSSGPVIYWMSRDQRVKDNWALLFAMEKARESSAGLIVLFTLVSEFLESTLRQYDFMLKGLMEVEKSLNQLNIPFKILTGNPVINIQEFIKQAGAACVITDFDPLKIKKNWKNQLAQKIQIPFYEVDAHNIVPCWLASNKQEFGAYTIRPKIKKQINEYLTDFPKIEVFSSNISGNFKNNWDEIISGLKIDSEVKPVDWIIPGEKAANNALQDFINYRLPDYNEKRNDPNKNSVSHLSPYLHFGQISAQRIAIEIISNIPADPNTEAFLEELIVRRELSDNFCFYNENYDSFEGFPYWAKKTLNEHRKDEREYIYTNEEFEKALTHDPLWNAAQTEMLITGKMHGYMRMYWAKKILEWTPSPEEALKTAICLNDKYELDGRDPNGYAGCAWSIGGVHDRAWGERPVFGKIRFMNDKGCKRKFDTDAYIRKHQ
jgi:deoxyribodipyrimidine photo-lyase